MFVLVLPGDDLKMGMTPQAARLSGCQASRLRGHPMLPLGIPFPLLILPLFLASLVSVAPRS